MISWRYSTRLVLPLFLHFIPMIVPLTSSWAPHHLEVGLNPYPAPRPRPWRSTLRTLWLLGAFILLHPLSAQGFLFVEKNNSLRPFIDDRGLNDIMIKNRYPLPLFSSAVEPLQGTTIFSKLDLSECLPSCYARGMRGRQLSTRPVDTEYLVMPCSLCSPGPGERCPL
jgi:hypothetical protein